jgi:phosphatidate cytidylyltransferase
MTRLISGVALAAAALAAVLFLPVPTLRIVACAVAGLAALEYVNVVRRVRTLTALVAALTLVVLTCWCVQAATTDALLLLLLAGMVATACEVLVTGRRLEESAALFLAPWYIGMPLGMLVSVHSAWGPNVTILLLATVVISDTAQYYSGQLFGRHLLAPAISPKKTIEGAIGGVLFGAVFMASAGAWLLPLARQRALVALGVVVVALGICGDLFESRLKRASGLKDSSTLIPGHGGVLDRIDALLFATPAFYLYLRQLP